MRALVIVAHADDMEFFAGGTIAKMINQGIEVFQIITTNNEKGSFTLSKEELIRQSREEEAKKAAEFLGLKEVRFLEYPDGELDRSDLWELKGKYMQHIRSLKPDILFTWDPFAPFEFHPDHRTVGMIATEASEFAHMPSFFPEQIKDGLEPHYVKEYYFLAKYPLYADKIVDISDTLEQKIQSLLIHKSQIQLTITDLMFGFKAAGIDSAMLGIQKPLDEKSYAPLIEMGIKKVAEDIGKKGNVPFGEAFRYKGFGMAGMVFPEIIAEKSTL